MKIELTPGKYVVAVSGGVDSVVLLNLLYIKSQKNPSYEFVVAHYDHGIRYDSVKDRKLVQALARDFGMTFEYSEGKLGPVGEAMAREKRYDFLRSVMLKNQAAAMITAHHQDDLLETAFLNMIRGTGRRGLSSLKSTEEIKRPLLGYSKKQILDYATSNSLTWHEDPTNQDETYLRNHIRHQLIPKLSNEQRSLMLQIIDRAMIMNRQIDIELDVLIGEDMPENLNRNWFMTLPYDFSREVMLAWLRCNGIGDVSRKLIEQLVVKSKTYKINSQIDVNKLYIIRVTTNYLALGHRDR